MAGRPPAPVRPALSTRRRRLVAALAIALAALVWPATPTVGVDGSDADAPPPVTSEPIVGGSEVTPPGAYPFIVYLEIGSSACGGALISDTWVVTAAHCVVDRGAIADPTTATAVIGRHDLSTSVGEEIGVRRIAIPRDALTTTRDDIAFLELDTPSQFGAPIRVARPADATTWLPGQRATVIGWGAIDPLGTRFPFELQELELDILRDDICRVTFLGYDPPNEICAGGTFGQDSCFGDSGGPLFVPEPGGSFMLIGVVSGGSSICGQGVPGVYTEVASYVELIESVTGLDLAPPPDVSSVAEAASATEPALRMSLGG